MKTLVDGVFFGLYYMECTIQPAGVGFSYGDAADEDTDEAGVREHMYNFLHGWFEAHPKYKDLPLYIFGESYGNSPGMCFKLYPLE